MGIPLSLLMIWLIIIASKPAFGMEAPPKLYAEPYVKELKKASKEAIKRGREESTQVIQFMEKQQEALRQLYETECQISQHLKQQLDKVRNENLELQQKLDELQELLRTALDDTILKTSSNQSPLQKILALLNKTG